MESQGTVHLQDQDALYPIDMEFKDRLKAARKAKKLTQAEIADALDVTPQAISGWERGDANPESEKLPKLAGILGVDVGILFPASSIASMPPGADFRIPGNAQILGPVGQGPIIPLYGQGSAGKDGEFPWNGECIQPVPAPPSLNGVRDAYALLVAGTSMEPRYYSGETVYVHPHLPAHRGHFVVAQIHGDEGQPPLGYIKRFLSLDLRSLRLEQLNPKKVLTFPAKRVKSIDRIVGSGE